MEKEIKFDYVSLDLDGTLLNDDKQVPQDNIDVILQLQKQGVKFIICTNRNIHEVYTMVPPSITDIVSYIICRDGLYVYDRQKKLKEFNLLGANDISVLIKTLKTSPLYCIGSKRHYYVFATLMQKIKVLIKRRNDYKNTCTTTLFFSKLLRRRFEKVMIFQTAGVSAENIGKIQGKYVVNYINDMDYDIFQRDVNKYNALLWLSQNTDLDLGKLLYFGDDNNDEYCFARLKNCVVMGNASTELKRYSFIENVPTNNEAGVAKVLFSVFDINK